MRTASRRIATACAGLLLQSALGSALTFTLVDVELSGNARDPVTESIVLLEGVGLKVSHTRRDGSLTFDFIYQQDEDRLVLVNHSMRSFTMFDRAWIDTFNAEVQSILADYENGVVPRNGKAKRELKRLHANWEKRKKAEQKDASLIRETDEVKTVSDLRARRYIQLERNALKKDVWISDLEELNREEDVVRLFRGLASIYRDVLEINAMVSNGNRATSVPGSSWIEHIEAFDGVPVQINFFNSRGIPIRRIAIDSLKEIDVEASEFAPPNHYSNEESGLAPQ